MPCRATQYRWITVESSDRTWSAGKGSGKLTQHSYLENPMNSMKGQKDKTLKDDLPRSVGAQHTTGAERRNSSRRREEAAPKCKQRPLWTSLVTEVKSDAVKSNISLEYGMLGP